MSEKKSNGQVPEEGPDGKNLEQSEEKESFAFLEETIKPKKISRQQGINQRKIQQKVAKRQSRMTCRISRRSVMYRGCTKHMRKH